MVLKVNGLKWKVVNYGENLFSRAFLVDSFPYGVDLFL
jgi:hypothetical protein